MLMRALRPPTIGRPPIMVTRRFPNHFDKKSRRMPAFFRDGSAPIAQTLLFDFGRPVGVEAVIEPGPALFGVGCAPLAGINPVRLAKDGFGLRLEAFI